MYLRDIPRLPISIPRGDFVNLVFTLGDEHNHNYASIVSSVQLGDTFNRFKGKREAFVPGRRHVIESNEMAEDQHYDTVVPDLIEYDNENDAPNSLPKESIEPILLEVVPQCYSVELAYVVTVLIGKFNEDNGLRFTKTAIDEVENCYIQKMEWEIYFLLHHTIRVDNFVTTMCNCLGDRVRSQRILPSVLFDICWDICLNETVLGMSHRTIITAIIVLGRRKQLTSVTKHRERRFAAIMLKLSEEYEIDYPHILQAYIDSH
jgi:hypothetical protein